MKCKVGLLQWNTRDDVQAVDLHVNLTESVSFQQVNAECGQSLHREHAV